MGGRRWSEWIPALGWVAECYQQPVCDVCGRRWSSLFKGFESEQLRAGYAEGSRLFYDTGLFFILACLYDWEQTRLIVTKVKSSTGSLV